MKQVLSILSLLFLVSCGSTLDYREAEDMDGTGDVDPSLSQFLENFENDMKVEIPGHLSINVVDKLENVFSSNVDAVCWSNRLTGVGQRIEIKRSRWEKLDAAGKEQLLYHELGHCVLNKGHTNGEGSCPFSIMNQYTFAPNQIENCYIPYHQYYLDELRG